MAKNAPIRKMARLFIDRDERMYLSGLGCITLSFVGVVLYAVSWGALATHTHTGLRAPLADLMVVHAVDGAVFPFREGDRERCRVQIARCGIEGEDDPASAIGAIHLDFEKGAPSFVSLLARETCAARENSSVAEIRLSCECAAFLHSKLLN